MDGERNRGLSSSKKNRKRNPECTENTKELTRGFSSFKTHPCQKNSQPNHICASYKICMLTDSQGNRTVILRAEEVDFKTVYSAKTD